MFLNQAMETGYSGNNNWQHYAKGEYKIEEEKQIKETEGRVEIQQEAVCWELQHQRIG